MCGCSLIGFEDFSEGVLNYGKKKRKACFDKERGKNVQETKSSVTYAKRCRVQWRQKLL